MVLKTGTVIRSQVPLIPWSSLDVEIEEIPERGLHWGIREGNYTLYRVKRPKFQAGALIRKSKGNKQDE